MTAADGRAGQIPAGYNFRGEGFSEMTKKKSFAGFAIAAAALFLLAPGFGGFSQPLMAGEPDDKDTAKLSAKERRERTELWLARKKAETAAAADRVNGNTKATERFIAREKMKPRTYARRDIPANIRTELYLARKKAETAASADRVNGNTKATDQFLARQNARPKIYVPRDIPADERAEIYRACREAETAIAMEIGRKTAVDQLSTRRRNERPVNLCAP